LKSGFLEGFRYTMFHREGGAYRVREQEGYPAGHVHAFLSEDPDSWAEALRTGHARVRGVAPAGFELWVVADPPGEPAELLVVELPESGAGLLLQRLVQSTDDRSFPGWVKQVLPLVEGVPSPALLVAEAGCKPDLIVQALLDRRLGPSARVEYFAPGRLSLPVQLREMFGDRATARLGGEAAAQPLVERPARAFVIQEAADLHLDVQRRLLDFLSGGAGGLWVFYTSQDLDALADEGVFARGFAEYLRPGRVIVPPLRQLKAWLIPEAERILQLLGTRYRRFVGLGQGARAAMAEYAWPGNWVELEQVIESAYFRSRTEIDERALALGSVPFTAEPDTLNFRERTAALERRLLLEAYALHSGNQVHMARALGISRGSLQYQMTKYGLHGE
jgi:transcriptional regulator of aromatic amino acid metabolism